MTYQSYVTTPTNVIIAFPWGMPNPYSAQGVEIKEILAANINNIDDQEPEYRGPPLNFHISGPSAQPNPYGSAAIVPPFPNHTALQYAHFEAPLGPNVQPGGRLLKMTLQLPIL